MITKAGIFKVGNQFMAIAYIKGARIESPLLDSEKEAIKWIAYCTSLSVVLY